MEIEKPFVISLYMLMLGHSWAVFLWYSTITFESLGLVASSKGVWKKKAEPQITSPDLC